MNGMEGTAVGECASLVGKVAHVTAGRRAACCLAENSSLMADCRAHHIFISDRFGRGGIMMKPTSRGLECLFCGFAPKG